MRRLLLRCVRMVCFAIVHPRSITTNIKHSRCERQSRTTNEGRLNALSCQIALLWVFLANILVYICIWIQDTKERVRHDHEANSGAHSNTCTVGFACSNDWFKWFWKWNMRISSIWMKSTPTVSQYLTSVKDPLKATRFIFLMPKRKLVWSGSVALRFFKLHTQKSWEYADLSETKTMLHTPKLDILN
jgi:hypothetical protein